MNQNVLQPSVDSETINKVFDLIEKDLQSNKELNQLVLKMIEKINLFQRALESMINFSEFLKILSIHMV